MLIAVEYFLPPGEDVSEMLVTITFFAGVAAPLTAVAGFILVKVGHARISRWVVAALVAAPLSVSWPLLFYLAYANCPNGIC